MLTMPQQDIIRDLRTRHKTKSEIARITGHDWKTVEKYLKQEDFSPTLKPRVQRPSVLDPYKPIILEMLEQDRKRWYKQQHTAKRIYDRLIQEHGYTGSYPTVQRFVKKYKDSLVSDDVYGELLWEPGQAQADFGEADFYRHGLKHRYHFFVLSFPSSNKSFVQVFRSVNSECVCQALLNIFTYMGGVPSEIVVDNATGIGRRLKNEIYETELFSRFRLHYKFQIAFCNPNAGHEKGHVENKVGMIRRNWFVPEMHVTSLEKLNQDLLVKGEEENDKLHYKKGQRVGLLFEKDRADLLPLNAKAFNVVRYEYRKADKYGKVQVDGPHYYATLPECRERELLIVLRADDLEIYDEQNTLLVKHSREYGGKRTDTDNPWGTLSYLSRHTMAWFNSPLRKVVSDDLRTYMDTQEASERKHSLKALQKLYEEYQDEDFCMDVLDSSLKSGHTRFDQTAVLAARLRDGGLDMPISPGPDIRVYDSLLESMVNP